MNLYSSLLRKAILLTVALAAAGSSLSAATLQWTNSAGGLWTAATNWSPNQVPATGDAVVITNAGNYTVTNTATVALASLALGAGGDTNLAGLQILGVISGTLNVTNTAVESNGLLRVAGGTVAFRAATSLGPVELANGSLEFTAAATLATLTQSGGDLGGLGTVTVVNGAALSGGTQSDAGTTVLQGSSTLTGTWGADTGRTLRNEGTFTWSAGVLDLNPLYHAAAANNVPAGRFINTGTFLASGNALTLLRDTSHNIYDSNGKALFVNEGTFTRTGATNGHLLTLSTRYNNLGALHLENGRLAFLLSGAHTNGTFTAAAASASLEFTGGTHTTQAGALTGAGALLVNGATLTLAADTGLSPGSLTVSAGSLTVNGPRTYLNPVTVNGGTLNWADPATLQAPLLASGSLNFAATATLATLTQSGGDLGGLGTVTVVNGAALSGGTQSDAGTTVLQGGSTLTGTWGADTGRTLRNEGTFTWSAGVLDLNPLYHAAAANNVPAGRFVNAGTLLATGNAVTLLRDTSHNIYDSNGKALFVNEGTFTRTGATNGHLLTLSTRYNNLGALHLENGRLAFLLSGAHTNGTFTAAAASASLEFTGGTHTTQAGALTGAGALLVNGATLTLAADTGLSPGSLTVSAGSLTVNGPRTYLNPVTVNGGTLNWADPATLQAPLLASGSLNFAATATLATLTQSGGDLGGLGTVTVVNGAALSGGTQSDAGTTVLQGSSTLTGTWGADTGRTLRNEGTFTWSAGVLDLNPLYHAAAANNVPAGRFINTGTFLASGNALTLLRDTSHNIYDSNGKALFVNEGTFTRTGATNGHLLTLSTRYNNLGALHLENGRLAFLLSGAHTNGTFTAAAASASLEFTGGTHTTQAGALTGAGALLVNGATLTLAADTGLSPGSLTVSAGSLTVNGPRTYLNPVTVNGGTLNWADPATLQAPLLASGSLNFAATATLATLTQSGGDLGGLGTVTVVNGATLSGGTQSEAGTTVLQGGSTLTGTWGADTGRTLRNEGTFTWSAGVLDLNPLYHAAAANNVPAGRFVNAGTLLATGNAVTLLRDTSHNIYDSNGKALFVNEGTFTRTGATNGHLLTLSTRYNNLGALHLENGRLAFLLSGAHTNGTFTAAAASASLEFTGGTHTTQAGALTGAGALLVNGATLTLAADTGLSPGSLTVSAGSLTVNGPRTYLNPVTVNGGTLNWADPATLQAPLLASGSLNFAATATLATLTQSGGDLGGLGTVTVVNGAALSGGTQSDAGTTVLQGSSTLTGTWGADTGRTLRNEGTFTWSAGVLDLNPLYHAAAANNVPAGRFINTGTFLASGNALTLLRDTSHNIYDSNGKALFVNEGTFTRTGATNGHLLTLSTRYNNLGALHLENGRLAFLLSGAHTNGTFTAAAASASLEFTGGTHTTQAGALTGAGALLVNGATLTLAADTGLSPGSLTVSAGSLTVNGPRTYLNPVTVNGGTLNWADPATLQAPLLASGSLNFAATATLATLTQSGGDLGGLGTVTVVNGAALSGGTQSDAGTTVLQGGSTLTGTWGADTGRTLRNEGTFTWSAGVLDLNPLYHAAAANNVPAGRFINTGTFLASGNALTLLRDTSHNIYDSNGKALFENQGSFLRFGSTNQALLTISVRLTNSSVVSIESGRVRLGLDFTQGAGSATLSSNLVADADVRIYGGTFTGLGTVAGQFLSAEQSSFGTPLGAFIAGSFTNWPFATLHLKLGGNNAGTNQDQLRVTGPAGLAGNLSLSFADGFTPAIGQSFTVMTYTARSGAFTNLAGPVGYEFQPVYTTTNLILNAVFFSNVPPVMTLHPSNRTVFAGATVRFDAAATGTEPLNWQWLRNNTPIAGATNAWFEVPSAQAANAGAYRVDVSNLGGFASSSNALLTVLPGFTLGTNFNLPVSLPWTSSTLQNSQVGYLAGPNGTILATYNGGATWTNIGPNVPVTFHNVQVVDGAIYAFGSNGHICVSYDGGQTWQLFPTGTSQTFYGGHFTGIGSGWAVGSGGTIYQLTNNAWVPHGSGSFANFQGVWSSGGGAWAVGSGGSICRYWNGGWYCGSYGGAGVTFYGVSFWPGGLHGLAVGSGGTIYRTGDGGISWFPVASGTGANLTSVTTVSYGGVDYAWIGGSGGTLLFSANGGGSWSSLGTGTSATITSVTFRDGYGIYTGADGSCNHFTFAPIPVNLPPAVAMLNQGILVTNTASGTLNNLACVPLTIFAVAADPDGVVTNLEFTVAARYATNNFAPRTYARRPGTYSFLWVNDLVGEFLVRAVATDNRGATAVALPLTINAIKGPPQTLVAGGFFTTNGSFKLCMCADTNAAWTLLANQDLNTTNWVPLGPMTYTNDLWRFFDLDATNYTYRFYRARRD